jgi:hypothetical protein
VKILKILPPQFLHEYALLLFRLGRHEVERYMPLRNSLSAFCAQEVLRIYVHHLSDHKLAESYCERGLLPYSADSKHL